MTSEMHLNDCSFLQQMIITMQKEWYCYNYNGKGNIDMTYINTGMQGIGMQICCFFNQYLELFLWLIIHVFGRDNVNC